MIPTLHLCIPAYGAQVHLGFETSRQVAEREGLFHSMSYVADSLVSRARNTLTQKFLDSSASHLFFIDSDIVFTPDDVRRLISALEAGHPIVGGLYSLKTKKAAWCLNAIPGEEPDKDGLMKVKYIGTGFLAVARSVFYKMAAAHPELSFTTDENEGINLTTNGALRCLHDFWSVGVYNGRYLSEDWFFCQRAWDLGIPVLAHTGIKLKHLGQIAYPIDPEPIANRGTDA